MIHYIDSDLFESPAKVLVNTVNTQGVMGKGVALRFKRIYPDMFERYQEHCEHGRLKIGNLHLHKTPHKWILNFPTKERWRNPSRTEYIEAGLEKFKAVYADMGIASIAFPQLGCGTGDLDFETQVKPLMERFLGQLPVPILIHLSPNHVKPPSRREAARIRKWLRSEPTVLSFDRVWGDLQSIVQERKEFQTEQNGDVFSVCVEDDPPKMVIESSEGNPVQISDDELIDFWQHFHDIGVTHPDIALNRSQSCYLMPIFERLPYVRSALVSRSMESFKTNPTNALQLSPPAGSFRGETKPLFVDDPDAA